MKHIHFTKRLVLAVCAFAFLATGCINEDLDQCYKLRLRVLNVAGIDITQNSRAQDATIYVFDGDGKYLESVTMTYSQIIAMEEIKLKTPYKEGMKLSFLAWGNALGAANTVNIYESQTMQDFKLMLATKEDGVGATKVELFGGTEAIVTAEGNLRQDEWIEIGPKAGTITMATYNLQRYLARAGISDKEFYLRLNDTKGGLDSEATPLSASAILAQDGGWTIPKSDAYSALNFTADEWVSPEVEDFGIASKDLKALIRTADGNVLDEDMFDYVDEAEIEIVPEKDTFVLFEWGDDGVYVGTRVIIRPWGYVEDPIEF
ncbi:FimB/Mfa2 family fimbrial subunit [Parabacteroides sp. OttesenSCG-928-J18]|nr:FimB/Mfa2 family fimbrial subunit [Parabacteroides sp. OttesenSCG-928-J18]